MTLQTEAAPLTRDRRPTPEDHHNLERTLPPGSDRGKRGGLDVAALQRLAGYRSAAQEVRRGPGSLGDKLARMIALAQLARAEADPFTREHAELVVYAQSTYLLVGDEKVSRRSGDKIEAAARRLRGQHRDCCPTCCRPLEDRSDWAFHDALRAAELARLEALDAEAAAA